MNDFSSNLLQKAVDEISSLPGIGRRTALRLALHILKRENSFAGNLGKAIIDLRENINYCKKCHNISDTDLCNICANPKRDDKTICVVEDIRDIMAIENTGQYYGVYHVLGGIISPMEGIGPEELHIDSLQKRCEQEDIEEIFLALPATVEGDTTAFYIYKVLHNASIRFSTIARGIAIGDELEYADEVTLGRSILNRQLYER